MSGSCIEVVSAGGPNGFVSKDLATIHLGAAGISVERGHAAVFA